MKTRLTGAAAFGLLLVSLFPTAAWAPRVFTVPTSLCETSATRGDFVGSFTLGRFSASDDSLIAEGHVTGICFGDDDSETAVNSDASVPMRVVESSCDVFVGELTTARVDGVSVDLSGQSIHFEATRQSRRILCRIADLVRSGDNQNALAGLLTSLLGRS